jgi:hypothetical protein
MKTLTKPLQKKERTPAQREAFIKAQVMNAMHAESPRARNEQKIYIALHHVQGWSFSTAQVTASAARTKSTSFITGMHKAGLIRYECVLGKKYIVLTRKGLELLRNMTDPQDEIAWQRAKMTHAHTVNLFAFAHNAYAQRLIASRQSSCWDHHAWISERQLRIRLNDKTEEGAKVPDACFITPNETIYFEIERSKKSKKEIQIMFVNLIRLIEHDESHRVEIHFLRNFSSSYRDVYKHLLEHNSCQLFSAQADGTVSELMTISLSASMRSALSRITFIEAM